MELKHIKNATFMIVKFSPETAIPAGFSAIKGFKSITYTAEECSLVVPTDTMNTQQAAAVDRDWQAIQVVGELDFSLVGILTQLINPLADQQVSIFALSTYNTDYLLIKSHDIEKACAILTNAGHVFLD